MFFAFQKCSEYSIKYEKVTSSSNFKFIFIPRIYWYQYSSINQDIKKYTNNKYNYE